MSNRHDLKKGTGRGCERRASQPRVSLDTRVMLRIASADSLFSSRLQDLSESGAYVINPTTRPVGTGITLLICVGTDEVIEVSGIVVHEVTPAEATPSQPAGFGLFFTSITAEGRTRLRALLHRAASARRS